MVEMSSEEDNFIGRYNSLFQLRDLETLFGYSNAVAIHESFVHSQFMDKSCNNLWAILLTKAPYKDDLRDILFLIEILLALPLSAAQWERAISAQNRIKNSHRASLASQTTEDLIRISAEGPSLNDFAPAPAVAAWFACAMKPRQPFCQS